MMFSLLLASLLLLGLYVLLYLIVPSQPRCKSEAKLHGKTAIVTGSNTGIGKEVARDLARRGARVILACRDQRRAEAALHDIVKETGSSQVLFMQLDLASLQSVRSFAENFLKSESRLDLLINNAGVADRGKTADGFGLNFGVNHLGHFLLTNLLLDKLKASGPSRVVTVASITHLLGKVDFSCLTTHRDVALGNSDLQAFRKYSHSKLCNVLFTYELAKRLQGSDVTCYSLDPGPIKTEISRYGNVFTQLLWKFLECLFFTDADHGAQTILHCSLEQGIEHLSGHYFAMCAPVMNMWSKARDDASAKKLWELSETFCGLS